MGVLYFANFASACSITNKRLHLLNVWEWHLGHLVGVVIMNERTSDDKSEGTVPEEVMGVKCKEWNQKWDQHLGYNRPGQVLIICGAVLYT